MNVINTEAINCSNPCNGLINEADSPHCVSSKDSLPTAVRVSDEPTAEMEIS